MFNTTFRENEKTEFGNSRGDHDMVGQCVIYTEKKISCTIPDFITE